MLLNLPSLFHSMFYKVFLYPWNHLLSTCWNHLRWFNLSFGSKGARFNWPYIVDRFTLSSAFICSIQHNSACLLVLLVHNLLQDRFHHQDNEMATLHEAVCLPNLNAFQVYYPWVCKTLYLLHLFLGSAFSLPLKPLHFLCIQDWHPSQKIELLLTLYNTHYKGVFLSLWVSAGFCHRS